MKRYLQIIIGFMLAAMVLLTGCSQGATGSGSSSSPAKGGKVTVTMLDIGQGDAILIQTGAKNVLIDTGDDKYYEDGKKGKSNDQLFDSLQKLNVTSIDTLVMTHAHADHIGKAAKVIQQYGVKELVYNGIPSTSKYFVNALKAAKEQGTQQVKVKAGDELDFGSGVTYKVLSPDKALIDEDTAKIKGKEKVDVNNESVVGMLVYGDFTMLLTGDAESPIEKTMVANYGSQLQAKVLKAGHHGSKTSSSSNFLKEVAPEAVVMSLGTNNQYGHPHEAMLTRLQKQGVKNIFRTDKNGAITITTDGKTYSITTEK